MLMAEQSLTALSNFTKRASTAFFKHYGLINHQINSYDDFIKVGIQKVFDSLGDIIVEPECDPSKKGDEWRFASVKFGKVTNERPRFWTGEKFSADSGKDYLEFLPRHARLQHMTCSSRLKVHISKQVYTQELVRSDKFKTGQQKILDKKVIDTEEREVYIGSIPVVINSDSCWMSGADKDDCDYD
ncbi:putative DNA-directed RNA polymerase [Helianthus annuus]|nr:putative DNA-directed RNA polymerase [Helianthus annuus]